MTQPPAAPASAGTFERVARLDDLADGGLLGVVLASGERVCLVRHQGEVSALADRCPHADFALSAGDVLPDGSVQCAWHGARFDRCTGDVKQGPARTGVRTYTVQVTDGEIWIGRS